MTAEVLEFKRKKQKDGKVEKGKMHVHKEGCSGCSSLKKQVKSKITRIRRDYAMEFRNYYLKSLEKKNSFPDLEKKHVLYHFEKILSDIEKKTEYGELISSQGCPNSILNKHGNKVAGDYFLIRYLRSGCTSKQSLEYARGCYCTWYEEDRLGNVLGLLLFEGLPSFMNDIPDFIRYLDFDLNS